MQIYFHSRLCSYLPRVPILVGGHCKKILTVKFLYKNGAKNITKVLLLCKLSIVENTILDTNGIFLGQVRKGLI